MIFYSVWFFYIFYRIAELILSKRNEKKLNNPLEIGKKQRFIMIVIHSLWFLSMLIEYQFKRNDLLLHYWPIIPLLLCTVVRQLSICHLGKYWNTKIFTLSSEPLVKRGLYKFIKHPNYYIVMIEIIFIPLLFGLNFTAAIFGITNIIFLMGRIKTEELSHKERC